MKKLIVLLLIGVLVLTGCTAKPSETTDPAPAETPTQPTEGEVVETATGWMPEKDVEVIIPFSAGGGSDVFARKVIEIIGKNNLAPVNFIPTNKPGGSGVVGYTYMNGKGVSNYIMATTSSSFYSQPLSGNSPLSCYDDFSFVAHLAKDPNLFAAKNDLGMTSLEEVIDYVRANPKVLKYGGTGNVSDDAILMYMVNELAGIELVYVPYDSGGEVLAAILGGHIDLCAISPAEAGEHLISGGLVPLAVSSDDRISSIPDVPTFREIGYDINHQQSRGIVMNAGIDDEVLQYYSDLLQKVAETDEWKTFVEENFLANSFMNKDEYELFNDDLADKYTKFMEIIERAQQ